MTELIRLLPLSRRTLREDVARSLVAAYRREGVYRSAAEARGVLQRWIERIAKDDPALVRPIERRALEQLASADWNMFQDDLLVDLQALYVLLGTIESSNRQVDQVTLSEIDAAKATIRRALGRLEVHRFLRENPDYQDLLLLDFTRAVNASPRLPRARIDTAVRRLELPPRSRTSLLNSAAGSRPTVEILHHGAGTVGGLGPDFGGEEALSPDPRRFFAEVVSSSGSLSQRVETSWGSQTVEGAVVELRISFPRPVQANHLRLLPFAEHPEDLIDLAYQDGQEEGPWITLPGFDVRRGVEDWEEFDFPVVGMSRLRVMIAQPNYLRNQYAVPRSLAHRESLWGQLIAPRHARTLSELRLSAAEESLVEVDPSKLARLSTQDVLRETARRHRPRGERRSAAEDAEQVFQSLSEAVQPLDGTGMGTMREMLGLRPQEQDDLIQVVRYEYLLGLRAIEMERVFYEPVAHYTSPPLDVSGNPTQLELEVQETHTELDDHLVGYRRTSVEYELEIAPGARYPIAPLDSQDGQHLLIEDERLLLRDGAATLRFTPSAGSVRVRRNGRRVPLDDVALSGSTVTVANAVPGAIYTASYHTALSSSVIRPEDLLTSTRLVVPERFRSTDQDDALTLSTQPHILYEIVRDRVRWEQPDPTAAAWRWNPSFEPVSDGTVALTNGATSVHLTLGVGDTRDFTALPSGEDLWIYLPATGETLAIASVTDLDDAVLAANYEGESASGLAYVMGGGIEIDGKIWGLSRRTYEPIVVTVDGVRAVNRSDYYGLRHPGFEAGRRDRIEFFQAGRRLYFNQPLRDRDIRVTYSWLTRDVRLHATLRCNIPVWTALTPKVDVAKIRVQSTEM